jgi:hypothetical protein
LRGPAVLPAAAALVAVYRFKLGPMIVKPAGGAAGTAYTLLTGAAS